MKKNIVLGITSGIAAYKMLSLITLLKKRYDITVIVSKSAEHFISKTEIQKEGVPVFTSLFDDNFNFEKILEERKVDHIEVAKAADLIVVAPATANTIAKLANGIADDFLTTTVLATTAPILIFPSMNTNMWFHPATQKNLKKLQQMGNYLIDPESGSLACGTEGIGRLPSVETIEKEIDEMIAISQSLKGKKIIVTAGGTIEPIDAARVITNRSSGKMGVAIAEECYRRGADILLLNSSSSIQTYLPIKQKMFTTADDLTNLIQEDIQDYDVIFHTAAVSDYTADTFKGKIDSKTDLNLELHPTTKIITKIKQWNPNIMLIGFKAYYGGSVIPSEVEGSLYLSIKQKFKETNADYIIANDISRKDVGFESDENEVIIFSKNGEEETIGKSSKKEIARKLLHHIRV